MYQNSIIPSRPRSLPIARLSISLILSVTFLFLVASCEESSFVGLEVQPQSDRFVVKTLTDEMIGTSVWKRDSILAIDNNRSLLGVFDDSLFGRLNASFLTQVGIFGQVDFGDNPVLDSLLLHLIVTNTYGGGSAIHEASVYEITDDIDYEFRYYSNFDPWSIADGSGVVGSRTFGSAAGDTLISIPITSTALQEKLLFAPDSVTQSLGNFINYFKGIYVKTALQEGDGNVFTINLNHANSRLSLYYHHAEVPDSNLRYDYIISEGANRINLFSHDFSTAVFNDVLEMTGTDDSLYYVQGAAGVMGRLDFDRLHEWRDSMPVSINSARLYLPVEVTADESGKYPVPPKIALFEKDGEGELFGVIDLALGDNYFGGTYNTETGQYIVNITNWVQAYVRGKKTDGSLYVSPRESGTSPNRAVFRNNNHSLGGPRLEIVYTKH